MNTRRFIALSLITGCALAYGIRHVGATGAPTVEPLWYSGFLEDAGVPVNGMRTIVLRIWRVAAGGNQSDLLCTTTRATQVTAGSFRVPLDPTCTPQIARYTETWIEAEVGGVPLGRTKVGAVPYALEASRASSAATASTAAAASGALAQMVVPRGMIAMFAGACPTGWAPYAPLQGRVPRGEPAYNAASLDTGGSDDAVVVAHTHGLQGNVSAAGDHQHGVNGTTQSSGNHDHGCSARTDTQGDHNHEIFLHQAGSGPNQGRWNMDWGQQGIYGADAAFLGTVGAGFQNFMSVTNGGSHGHNVSCSVDVRGAHAHDMSFASGAAGGHTHSLNGLSSASAGVAGAGANLSAYREVIFCQKS
jgi:hypothetical protein